MWSQASVSLLVIILSFSLLTAVFFFWLGIWSISPSDVYILDIYLNCDWSPLVFYKVKSTFFHTQHINNYISIISTIEATNILTMSTERLSSFLYSTSNFLALPFERNFVSTTTVEFAKNNAVLPIAIVGAYLLFCYCGRKVMENIKPFNLQLPLAIWNAFLCLFSFIGMCRTVGNFFFHSI